LRGRGVSGRCTLGGVRVVVVVQIDGEWYTYFGAPKIHLGFSKIGGRNFIYNASLLFLFLFSLFLFHFFITNNLSRSFFIQHHLRRKSAAPTAIVEEIRISVTHVYHENLESSIPKVCHHSLL
jgi:hypothetical protein